MADAEYVPPAVWTWDKENGGAFANINRPTAGAQFERELPVGEHPFQLYSLATPNGQKVGIMFEELLAKGHSDAEYDAWPIRIGEGDQFSAGFVEVNPNSKIPALVDRSGPDAGIECKAGQFINFRNNGNLLNGMFDGIPAAMHASNASSCFFV